MLAIAVIGGIWIGVQPAPKRADLVMWTFADMNQKAYREPVGKTPSLTAQFTRETGKTVNVELMILRAVDTRLISLFMSNATGERLPDVVETEVNSVGKFFRPPVEDVGFVPLNGYLMRDGWMDKIVKSRLAPWSKQGFIFLLPHDVHPVSITYRKDLFDQAGVNLESAKTWPAFQEKCLTFQAYWRERGYPNRMALETPQRESDLSIIMLLQQHVNILDGDNRVHFDDPKVADTVCFFSRLAAGVRCITTERIKVEGQAAENFVRGDACAVITPDWRLGYLRQYAGERLKGKLHMMALPKFHDSDAPTGTWGGSAAGIPRNCRDPEMAWKLLEKLYLKHESMLPRRAYANVLSPVMEYWDDPEMREPDPLMGGQKTYELYATLAREIPERYVTPYTLLAGQILNQVIYRAATEVERGRDTNLKQDVREMLAAAQKELEKRIRFGTFDEPVTLPENSGE
jgi:ABC-type glycerol-3-phosphate transport system substrate-binding protein